MAVCSKCKQEREDLQWGICFPCWRVLKNPTDPDYVEENSELGDRENFEEAGPSSFKCGLCQKQFAYKHTLEHHAKTCKKVRKIFIKILKILKISKLFLISETIS